MTALSQTPLARHWNPGLTAFRLKGRTPVPVQC